MTWENAPNKAPPGFLGFVYEVLDVKTGKRYIGQTTMWEKRKLPPLKGKKNKRHKIYETKWREYNTSNPMLKEQIPLEPLRYRKRILKYCRTKTDLKAMEAYLQLKAYFEGDWNDYINEVINLRLRIRKTK